MLKYAVIILWRKKGVAANFYAFCISGRKDIKYDILDWMTRKRTFKDFPGLSITFKDFKDFQRLSRTFKVRQGYTGYVVCI